MNQEAVDVGPVKHPVRGGVPHRALAATVARGRDANGLRFMISMCSLAAPRCRPAIRRQPGSLRPCRMTLIRRQERRHFRDLFRLSDPPQRMGRAPARENLFEGLTRGEISCEVPGWASH